MRSKKLPARLAMCVGALALSCARGVDPDPEDTPEPGAANASTEEPTLVDDAEEDAGGEEVTGTGDEGADEDEDRARSEGDIPNDADRNDWSDAGLSDAGLTDAQQAVDAGAGGALDASVAVACCRADGSCGCSWAPGAYCIS